MEVDFVHFLDKTHNPSRVQQGIFVGLLQERCGQVAFHMARFDHNNKRMVEETLNRVKEELDA